MKNKILFLISLVFIILAGVINSTNVEASPVEIEVIYVDINTNYLTIMDGEQFGVIVTANSILEDSMTINLDLLDSNGNLVTNLLNVYTTNDNYYREIVIGQSSYVNTGDYILRGTVRGSPTGMIAVDDVYLEVRPITPGNHPPVIISSPPVTHINEHQVFSYQVVATDQDNDPLTYFFIQSPNWLSITNNGFITGIAPEVSFDYEFIATVRVSDGQDFDTQTFTITVRDVPFVSHDPVISILRPAENEIINGIYNIRWNAYDQDQLQETLDIKLEYSYNGYEWVILEDAQNNNDGTFAWNTLSLSNANDYKLRATVKDDQNNEAQDEVNFIVRNIIIPTNHAPSISFIQPKENERISGVYDVLWNAYDQDQDPMTLNIRLEYRSKEENLFTNILRIFVQDWIILEESENNDGTFAWNTNQVDNGVYELKVITEDDGGLIDTDYVISFTIKNIQVLNHAPVIVSAPVTNALVNKLYNYDVNAIDQDNDILFYSLLSSPNGMMIDNDNGLISWTPLQLGSYQVTIKVTDNKGGTDSQDYVMVVSEGQVIDREPAHVHRFTINNVILRYNNGLNVYTYLRNYGTEDEKITIRATIMQSGMQEIGVINLDSNDNKWQTLTFDSLKSGYYVVKIEAFNSKHYEVRYAYTL